MPRNARKKSNTGIYHVIMRGINRQELFHDEDDYQKFLEIMDKAKTNGAFELYGFCLMGNHIHLLIHEKNEELAIIMKRICTSYAWWYNWKNERVGHVFQDRFKSETVEDETYLVSVLRYIHNNPVKAKIVDKPEQYRWSSCSVYYGKKAGMVGLVNTSFIVSIFAKGKDDGLKGLKKFMGEQNEDKFLEDEAKIRKTDQYLRQEIEQMVNNQPLTTLQTMDKNQRNTIIRQLKEMEGVTQRQIARVTGINQSTIFKA